MSYGTKHLDILKKDNKAHPDLESQKKRLESELKALSDSRLELDIILIWGQYFECETLCNKTMTIDEALGLKLFPSNHSPTNYCSAPYAGRAKRDENGFPIRKN